MSKPKKKKTADLPPYLTAAILLCAVLALAVIVSAIYTNRNPVVEFIPPAFEPNAETGIPQVSDALGYAEIYREGMTFSAWICGRIYQENGHAVLYFTNPDSNNAWLKLRIMDEKGKILGESGLIRPGEYVRSVRLTKTVAAGTAVKIKLMSYEPETYYSLGAVSVKTQISGGNGSN